MKIAVIFVCLVAMAGLSLAAAEQQPEVEYTEAEYAPELPSQGQSRHIELERPLLSNHEENMFFARLHVHHNSVLKGHHHVTREALHKHDVPSVRFPP